MRSELEAALDPRCLLSMERFLEAFCLGCPEEPELPCDTCVVGNNPADDCCVRRVAFRDIKETLEGAHEDIVLTLRHWGIEL